MLALDWHAHLIMFGQVILAFLLGLIVGIEREYHHSPAGIRTYAAVCLGACVFGLISTHAQGGSYYHSVADPTRIAAQIVSGIGFLGAGVIFRDGSKTNGLTTAATIWAIAAVGLAIAFEMYLVAIVTTCLIIVLLSINYFPPIRRWKMRARRENIVDHE
jgi:putative Mg2+ transporter-C (MgtC) family protein